MTFDDNDNPEIELPDWLKNLNDSADEESFSGSQEADQDGETTEEENYPRKGSRVFRSASDKDAAEFLQGEVEDDTEAWLQKIREQQGSLPEATGVSATSKDEDDFLEILQGIKKKDHHEDDDTRDWLANLSEEDFDQEEASYLDPNEMEPQGVDWVSGLKQAEPIETEADEEEIEIPDWLIKIKEGKSLEDDDLNDPVEEDTERHTGEWIERYTSSLDPKVVEKHEEFKLKEELGWLDNNENLSPGVKDTHSDPSWLTEMEDLSPADSTVDVPDINIEETVIDQTSPSNYQLGDFNIDEADIPQWLNLEPDKESPKQAEVAASLGEESTEVSIEPGVIPHWLKSIKPGSGRDSEQPEQGPLSGLQNVLPLDSQNLIFGNKHSDRSELSVSQNQQAYVGILKKIIQDEQEPQPTTRREVARPQTVLRWLIALVLYAVVAFPFFIPAQKAAPRVLPSPEVQAMQNIINDLEEGEPVLLVLEYQPGLSSEMEAASAAVSQQILQKNVQLVFLSTSPTGPGLIEKYTNDLLESPTADSQAILNLGYLSGGSAAILNFSSNPQGAIPIVNMKNSGANAWSQAPLNQIDSIRDFKLVLLLTDDSENARIWIEQLTPYLQNNSQGEASKLAVIASAQAGPLIQPYMNTPSQQVTTLLIGLADGVAFETNAGVSLLASSHWQTFTIALNVSCLIILLGSVYSLISGWRARQKRSKQ